MSPGSNWAGLLQFLQQDDHAELIEIDQEERLDDGHGAEHAAEKGHQSEGEPAPRRHGGAVPD